MVFGGTRAGWEVEKGGVWEPLEEESLTVAGQGVRGVEKEKGDWTEGGYGEK